jgi:hypothetical protein
MVFQMILCGEFWKRLHLKAYKLSIIQGVEPWSGQLHPPATLSQGKCCCYPWDRAMDGPENRCRKYLALTGTRTPISRSTTPWPQCRLRYPGSYFPGGHRLKSYIGRGWGSTPRQTEWPWLSCARGLPHAVALRCKSDPPLSEKLFQGTQVSCCKSQSGRVPARPIGLRAKAWVCREAGHYVASAWHTFASWRWRRLTAQKRRDISSKLCVVTSPDCPHPVRFSWSSRLSSSYHVLKLKPVSSCHVFLKLKTIVIIMSCTETQDCFEDLAGSRSGTVRTRFKFRPGHRISCLVLFMIRLSSSKQDSTSIRPQPLLSKSLPIHESLQEHKQIATGCWLYGQGSIPARGQDSILYSRAFELAVRLTQSLI